jgi:hypothetical protein
LHRYQGHLSPIPWAWPMLKVRTNAGSMAVGCPRAGGWGPGLHIWPFLSSPRSSLASPANYCSLLCRIEIPFKFHMLHSGLVHGLAFWFDVAFIGSM